MADKPGPKELEALLTRIMTKKPEPPDPPVSQDQSQERVIETEKIVLRDGSGKSRGKISANEDGSAGLILSDSAGTAWAWLGINQDGEAFLELKDKKGEICFKVPAGTLEPPAPAASPEAPPVEVVPEAPEPSEPEEPSPPPPGPQEESSLQENGPEVSQPPPLLPSDWHSGFAETEVYERLARLERKNRNRNFFRTIVLGLLAVILAAQAFLFMRPQSPKGPLETRGLSVRDQNGYIRAWLGEKNNKLALELKDQKGMVRATLGLGSNGSPALVLYDETQRVRAELQLGPSGAPRFFLGNKESLQGKTELQSSNASDNQLSLGVSTPGNENDTMASPAAPQDETVAREAAAETIYVGSITSNKYHFPACKWAKTIKPSHLIKFKSVEEAQEKHYNPCPVCKPPPLSK